MSDSDSFIDEVTEEVRRDRLYATFRRWAPVAALAIVLLVGGAAWNEYRKASARAEAEALGDAIIAALEADAPATRAERLQAIDAGSQGGQAVLRLLTAAAQVEAGAPEAAVAGLDSVATMGDLPDIYRQLAAFKALTLQSDSLPAEDRRTAFEALARPGQPLRLLAEEQLALIEIEQENTQAAIDRFQAVLSDAEASPSLRDRASQMIVALGGTPGAPARGGTAQAPASQG